MCPRARRTLCPALLLPQVVIIHTHGPKPPAALCAIGYIQAHSLPVERERDSVLQHSPRIAAACGLQAVPWLHVLLRLAASAAAADGGGLYRRVAQTQDRLCPGLCWQQPQQA